MLENIKSGAEYAQLLIDNIIEGEKQLPADQQLPINLLTYWCDEIKTYAEVTYYKYLVGKRSHFSFDEDEIRDLFEKAGMRYSGDLLEGLMDKEMVQMGIRDDGEIVYSATDKGKKTLDDYEKGNINPIDPI